MEIKYLLRTREKEKRIMIRRVNVYCGMLNEWFFVLEPFQRLSIQLNEKKIRKRIYVVNTQLTCFD